MNKDTLEYQHIMMGVIGELAVNAYKATQSRLSTKQARGIARNNNPCTGEIYDDDDGHVKPQPCWLTTLSKNEYCKGCKATQLNHDEFIKAVKGSRIAHYKLNVAIKKHLMEIKNA